jgi:hypothetical protein
MPTDTSRISPSDVAMLRARTPYGCARTKNTKATWRTNKVKTSAIAHTRRRGAMSSVGAHMICSGSHNELHGCGFASAPSWSGFHVIDIIGARPIAYPLAAYNFGSIRVYYAHC